MSAIYTAVRPPTPEQLVTLARGNEAQTYGPNRRTLGRRAIAELAATFAPPSHAELARIILERDLWGFLTPAATRGNHAVALQSVHVDLAVPVPLWPSTVELACIVGVAPAHYIGNNLVMLPPELVAGGVGAFAPHEDTHEIVHYLNEFLRAAHRREDAVLIHWDLR